MASIDTSHDRNLPLEHRQKPCSECGNPAFFARYCGAWVCDTCELHQGLARCYCGWSRYGRDGRAELIEMGEQIEEDY